MNTKNIERKIATLEDLGTLLVIVMKDIVRNTPLDTIKNYKEINAIFYCAFESFYLNEITMMVGSTRSTKLKESEKKEYSRGISRSYVWLEIEFLLKGEIKQIKVDICQDINNMGKSQEEVDKRGEIFYDVGIPGYEFFEEKIVKITNEEIVQKIHVFCTGAKIELPKICCQ